MLVSELAHQADLLQVKYEIIVIDDGSQRFKDENKTACHRFNYIELNCNIGRSKIRNLFTEYAQFDYLLFLDCDSLVVAPDFVSNYISAIQQQPDVVCGGRMYESKKPSREKLLRWKYGVCRESKSAEERSKQPSKSFMTNNFLIRKAILKSIRFDERLTQYGHEDTLFGFALKRNEITVMHIHNPVLNGDIETNDDFLSKTKAGIENLHSLMQYANNDPDLVNDISLLRINHKIKALEPLVYTVFKLCKPVLIFTLSKGFVSIAAFGFFKLGYLIESRKRMHE
jgi:GT2 family glycosyltransferase